MNEITKDLLERISDFKGSFDGAYNLSVDGACAGRQSSENIRIDSKTDNPGLEIHIRPGTKGERVSIPACVTHGDVNDLVYNDFFVGAGADVTIVAGCGVHTETGEPARHNGIHRFFLEEGAHVLYLEKHIGTGKGEGLRSIDPVTEATLEKDAVLTMDTAQIGGVDHTVRTTSAVLGENAKLIIRERIFTSGEQFAETNFRVALNGAGSGADVVSRSVAREHSRQNYISVVEGNAPCTGHTDYRRRRARGRFPEAQRQPPRCGADSRSRHRQNRGRTDSEAAHARPY